MPQFNNVDLVVLGLFTSRTEKRRPVKFKFSLEKLKSQLKSFYYSLLNTNVNMCHRPYAKMSAFISFFCSYLRPCPHVSGNFFFRKHFFADTKIFASTGSVFESFSAVHT